MGTKLVFLDIDGTLTEPGSNTPPSSALEAIRKAREKGNRVFLCSGRNPGMLSPLLRFEFDGYVASAGGYVAAGGKVLFDCPMPTQLRDLAMKLFRENGVFRTVETRDGAFCDENFQEFLARAGKGNSELERWRRSIESELGIRPMSEFQGEPVYKIVFMSTELSALDPARAALEDRYQFVIQDPEAAVINGELIDRRFNKGTGVRLAAETLGIPIEDTVGFGDSMNDLEMIETVGVSVCMDNGSPALKARSSLVCPAVTEDGLARAFEQLGLV